VRDALGSVQSLLVLGAGSDIAAATARRLVSDRTRTVVLAARRPGDLTALADELEARGAATVECVAFDAAAADGHEAFVADLERFGDLDVALLAFGLLGDQAEAERDAANALDVARVNYLGTMSIAVPLANRMRLQGHGTIVALSSVAGERARRSNFVYGSSKAGMDAFLQGLGDSLVGSGVRVMIVRPGFVDTKMTEGMSPAPLATTPDAVAEAIAKGLAKGSEIVWVPGALRYVMSALRHVPRPIFRKLPV
jgi:decaprenylphospho-beta-D-erythro-pentofuranosid-2-ulose 2-reductase